MTHRVHPYIFRIGQIRTWKSRWFGNRRNFSSFLYEDILLREWLLKKLRGNSIDSLELERAPGFLHIIIKTSRPGLLIGRSGEGIEKLKNEIHIKTAKFAKRKRRVIGKRELKITVEEVRSPETHAAIVAHSIVEELEKRMPFRRSMKQALDKVSASKDVKGVKIVVKGRLDGAEIARIEWAKKGRIPLQTLRADIDYANDTAYTSYGTVGVKVWIYKGDVFADKSQK